MVLSAWFVKLQLMGDGLSTCCSQPTQNQLPPREVVGQDGSQFKHRLQEFFNRFPKIKEVYDRKWNYCHSVDKNAIAINTDAAFVGGLGAKGQPKEMIVMYEAGFFYEGEIIDEKRQGLGRLISFEGDCYEGKWADNQPEGEGTYQGATPHRKYTGVWSKGQLQGRAKASYQDGSFYQGQFYQNMRQGKGKIKYPDGTIYEGDFKHNIVQGFGTLIGINHKYQGSWRDGKMEGAGKSYWYGQNDQLLQTYEGEYLGGVKQGKGEYRWSTGRVFKGEWQNGDIKREKEQHRNQ